MANKRPVWFSVEAIERAKANPSPLRNSLGEWIIDHDKVEDDRAYIVCAIGQRIDGSTYLYRPQIMIGWQFKRLTKNCYAAIPMPEWKGFPVKDC